MENKELLPAHLKQEVDEAEKDAIARMEIEYQLRHGERYKEFFTRYHPDDVEEFIKAYSGRKITWISWGKFYYEHNEDHQLRFYNQAQACLWQIQQKKLFNLQCQWRAEKIKLPGIHTTIEFRFWENNIRQCTFIPPITPWEFELYTDYLQSDEVEIDPMETDFEFEWQDYIRFSDDFNSQFTPRITATRPPANAGSPDSNRDEILVTPLWYQYFDNRMGTDSIMSLPDVRGEKEAKYLKIYYDHINKDKEKGKSRSVGVQNFEPLPTPYSLSLTPYSLSLTSKKENEYLSVYNPAIIEKFVRTFEDKEVLRYFLSYEKSHKQTDFADELAEVAFKELRELNEEIPVNACADWREALIEAWEGYRRKQILKLLPLVYEDYLQKQELGISYQPDDTKEILSEVEEWKSIIIKGRELLNEPPDFSF